MTALAESHPSYWIRQLSGAFQASCYFVVTHYHPLNRKQYQLIQCTISQRCLSIHPNIGEPSLNPALWCASECIILTEYLATPWCFHLGMRHDMWCPGADFLCLFLSRILYASFRAYKNSFLNIMLPNQTQFSLYVAERTAHSCVATGTQ